MPSKINILSALILLISLFYTYKVFAQRPVLLELFTSQGCSSCPPADKVAEQLALNHSDKVLPISMHVSYWNYLGWKDPFSSKINDERQSIYARNFAKRSIYTPQAVIDGNYQTVGSQTISLSKLIDKAYKEQIDIPITVENLAKNIKVSLKENKSIKKAKLIMFELDKKHLTKVSRGENTGKTLISTNTVHKMQVIADWNGKDFNKLINKPKSDRILFVLQEANQKQILGLKILDI